MRTTAVTIDDQGTMVDHRTIEDARAHADRVATERPGFGVLIFTLAEVRRGTVAVQSLTPAQYQAEKERAE